MPFAFVLPTIPALDLSTILSCPSHPALIQESTSSRAILRDRLKCYKRLRADRRPAAISGVQSALEIYISHLCTLVNAVTNPTSQLRVEWTGACNASWRATLTSTLPGIDPPRVPVNDITNEFAFALQTLAYTYSLQARVSLLTINKTTSVTTEQRAEYIASSMKLLLVAQSIHVATTSLRLSQPSAKESKSLPPIDITSSTRSALADLTMSEATALAVHKSDPYAEAAAKNRDKDSKDWMISTPVMPQVRAHLFARLCITASDQATRCVGQLIQRTSANATGKISEALCDYVESLRCTCRARAMRFLAIDAEAAARTGEAIAWLRAAKQELGLDLKAQEDNKSSRFRDIRQSLAVKKLEKKLAKDAEGGDQTSDAGRAEEAVIVLWLERKWTKMNDTVSLRQLKFAQALTRASDQCATHSTVRAALENIALRQRLPHTPCVHNTADRSSQPGADARFCSLEPDRYDT